MLVKDIIDLLPNGVVLNFYECKDEKMLWDPFGSPFGSCIELALQITVKKIKRTNSYYESLIYQINYNRLDNVANIYVKGDDNEN